MPRAMWKGAISFGLVSVPVKVYPATEEKTLQFHQLHDEDHGRIRYQRVCAKCGEEVPYDNIVSGYEHSKGRYVVLTDDEREAVGVESTRAIGIGRFVDLDEIDPIYYEKSYYLVPEKAGVKAYHLLREAMGDERRVGIGTVTFRDKEHLAAVRLRDDMLVLATMHWPDEIREAKFDELRSRPKTAPNETRMARSLIDSLTETFRPDDYRDRYRRALMKVIEKKVAGEEIEVIEEPARKAEAGDLMDALRRSVEAAQKKRKPKRAQTRKTTRRKAAS